MAAVKIYNEITMDALGGDWAVLSEDSFIYEGDIALCGGGGGGGKGSSPQAPAPPPKPLPQPEYVQEEAEAPSSREEDAKRRRRAGVQRGILTSPLGTMGGGLGSSGGM